MNPQVASPMTISKFTILAFEDLGWYKGVNAEQLYTYLKGDGCSSITGMECKTESQEYCSRQEWGHDHCYPNRLGKGACGSSGTFMGSCGYVRPKTNALCIKESDSNHKTFSFESYGAHSRCFLAEKRSNDFDAACLRSRCKNNKVEIQFGKEVFTCPSAGKHQVDLDVFKGKVDCPAYSEICEELLEERCPFDCYGQGFCMSDNTCQCLSGFTGKDCNDGLEKEIDPFVTEFEKGKEKKPENEDEKTPEEDPEEEEEEEDEKEEEEEDEDPEQEDPEVMDPKALQLIKKIKKISTNQLSKLQVNDEMIMFHILRVDKLISTKGATTAKLDAYKKKLEEKLESLATKLENTHQTLHDLETDLNELLTATQLANFAKEFLAFEEQRYQNVKKTVIAKLQYWEDRYAARADRYQKRIQKLENRKDRCNSSWCTETYEGKIEKVQKMFDFNVTLSDFCKNQKELKQTEAAIKGAEPSAIGFDGVEEAEMDMAKEMKVESSIFKIRN